MFFILFQSEHDNRCFGICEFRLCITLAEWQRNKALGLSFIFIVQILFCKFCISNAYNTDSVFVLLEQAHNETDNIIINNTAVNRFIFHSLLPQGLIRNNLKGYFCVSGIFKNFNPITNMSYMLSFKLLAILFIEND